MGAANRLVTMDSGPPIELVKPQHLAKISWLAESIKPSTNISLVSGYLVYQDMGIGDTTLRNIISAIANLIKFNSRARTALLPVACANHWFLAAVNFQG